MPSNIAEGYVRQHTGEFRQFLYIAQGSLAEMETQLFVAENLGYLPEAEGQRFAREISEIGKMINGLISKIK